LSKNKGNSFEQNIPPAYVPQICQKTKVIHLRLRYTTPETGGCDPSVNRVLQVYQYFVGIKTKLTHLILLRCPMLGIRLQR